VATLGGLALIAWAVVTEESPLRAAGPAAAPSSAVAGTAATAAGEGADREDLRRRVAELEAAVAALKAEVARLRAEAARAGGPPGGGTGSTASGLADLEARIEALTREIERLRIGAAASPPAEQPAQGLGPAAAKVYAARRGVSIGGYGEMLYENFARRLDDEAPSNAVDRADFLRAVLYFGYKFDDRFLFNSEIEYEHAVAGDGEPGEVALEFAYLDFSATKALGVRGGLLLVPMGFLNELHEPPIFHGARRPEVERVIIPSTWREIGVGVYGDAGPVTYRAYLTTSLDASGFTAAGGIRGGRQEGAEAKAADFALTARVDYTPVPGLLVGGSVFSGKTGQDDPALGEARLTLWDAHAAWDWRGLHLRALYARGRLGDAAAVSAGTGETIGSRALGWYVEGAYNVLAPVKGTDQELSPFCRYEDLDTQERVAPGLAPDPANDRRVRTCGLTYRPIPNIVIKLDGQNFSNGARTALDQVNLGLGYLF
jgi:uncharacterized small protein (DUF1192 family)